MSICSRQFSPSLVLRSPGQQVSGLLQCLVRRRLISVAQTGYVCVLHVLRMCLDLVSRQRHNNALRSEERGVSMQSNQFGIQATRSSRFYARRTGHLDGTGSVSVVSDGSGASLKSHAISVQGGGGVQLAGRAAGGFWPYADSGFR